MVRMVLTLLAILLSTIHLAVAATDVDPALFCSGEFCSEQECTPPLEHCAAQNATHSGKWMLSQTLCNCCEYCLVYLLEDEECTQGSLGSPPSGNACGPGLTCATLEGEDYSTCQRMDTPCHQAQDEYDQKRESGTLGNMEQRLECDEEGNFGANVCIPGQTCYCTEKGGNRIFGEVINEKNAGVNMLCGCSRMAYVTADLLGQAAKSLRCSDDGSYDPMQCADNRCFCVNPDTGVLSSVKVVDMQTQSLAVLPCFDPDIHHSNHSYLRECEENKLEMLNEMKKAESEGYSYLGSPVPWCQPDGNYGSIMVKDGMKYCVNSRREQIQKFEADLSSPASKTMDCNCARTYDLLLKASSPFLPACCANGNWRPVQCRRGYCYCVDLNGLQRSAEVEIESVSQLSCYTNNWMVC